jgi:hypothetical protein
MSLQARDNPFFPTDGELEIPFTSNKDRSKEPLRRATIVIPSQARVIKKVIVEFKNLDGSIESKVINLDNSIDWHLPLFISQKYTQSSLKQNSKGKEQKLSMQQHSKYKKLGSIKYATFYSNAKILKIKTKDKIIRNFLLTKPHRIILDFDRDTSLKYKSINIKNNIFRKIRIGNHDKYYRVVVELDGFYKYKMKQISDGYIVELE